MIEPLNGTVCWFWWYWVVLWTSFLPCPFDLFILLSRKHGLTDHRVKVDRKCIEEQPNRKTKYVKSCCHKTKPGQLLWWPHNTYWKPQITVRGSFSKRDTTYWKPQITVVLSQRGTPLTGSLRLLCFFLKLKRGYFIPKLHPVSISLTDRNRTFFIKYALKSRALYINWTWVCFFGH